MKKVKLLYFIYIIFISSFLMFAPSADGLTMITHRPTIGLALGEGGMRGFVHIGVIKVLLSEGYDINYIAGTSIGSMVGGLYALWRDIDKVEDFMLNLNFDDFIKLGTNNLKFKKFGDQPYLTLYFNLLSKKTKISFLSGLISSIKVRDALDEITNRAIIDYELSIPYKAVATDLISGKKITIGSGRLSNAIAGSICVPGFFTPLPYKKMYLIDGGIKDPVPVDIIKDMGADITIAVGLRGISTGEEVSVDNVISIIERSMFIMIEDKTKESVKDADILIAPKLRVKSLDFGMDKKERKKLIELGEKEMKKALPLLEEEFKRKKKGD